MFRGCEVNNCSLCIKHSLFHQHQPAWLCIFVLLCRHWKCLGIMATVRLLTVSHSMHPEPGTETDVYLGHSVWPGHTRCSYMFFFFFPFCPPNKCASLPCSGSFDQVHWEFENWNFFLGFPSDFKWNLLFSPEGSWACSSQVSYRSNDCLTYEPAHD